MFRGSFLHSLLQRIMMIDTPELLAHIGQFLDPESCLACIAVCRLWRQVYTPCLWKTIIWTDPLWLRTLDYLDTTILEPGYVWNDPKWGPFFSLRELERRDTSMEFRQKQVRLQRITSILSDHSCHIRHLTIDRDRILQGALLAGLESLSSLVFCRSLDEVVHNDDDEDEEVDDLEEGLALLVGVQLWEYEYSHRVFYNLNFRRSPYRSRAQWRLTLNNPYLRRLEFHGTSSTESPGLTAETIHFLVFALARLPLLRHMEIGQNADDFLLTNLATMFLHVSTFVFSDDPGFDSRRLQSHTHPALRRLLVQGDLSAEQFRAVIAAFPGLMHLSIRAVHNADLEVLQSWDYLEHQCLVWLWVQDLEPVVNARVRLPKITTVSPGVMFTFGFVTIFEAVKSFPALETLSVITEGGIGLCINGFQDDDAYPVHSPGKTLAVWNIYTEHDLLRVGKIVSHLGSVVRLELCELYEPTLVNIADTCPMLEYFRFVMEDRCPKELNQVFVKCAHLKVCVGWGHFLPLEDFINGLEWICLGLERLDIVIEGVPRLTVEQEQLLDRMKKFGLSEPQSVEETEALKQQLHSYEVQRQAFQRLARLKELTIIDLGHQSFPDSKDPPFDFWTDGGIVFDSLEFTLSSGLAELAPLKKVRMIGVKDVSHRIDDAAKAWMLEQWSMREIEPRAFFSADALDPQSAPMVMEE
ncbi:hypothetical protein BGW39_000040 [Mortierella sp. 14UC]|nr:hypothetical protein BGW39_000040 [Mortierella sp. 14UC]